MTRRSRIIILFNSIIAIFIAYLSCQEFDHIPIGDDLELMPSYAVNDIPFFIQKALVYLGISLIISFFIILIINGAMRIIKNIHNKI